MSKDFSLGKAIITWTLYAWAASLLSSCTAEKSVASNWTTVQPENNPWHTTNLVMSTVATDFNSYHHFVGMPRKRVPVSVLSSNDGTSLYIPLSPGPYKDKSVLEVQFNSDKEETVRRFRFLEKSGTKYVTGQFSSWQMKDFGPPHGIDRSADMDKLTFYSRECFDQKKWVEGLLFRGRQVWDLVHSNPLIGMNRTAIKNLLGPQTLLNQKSENIEYYQLGEPSDNLSAALPFLELKYENNRVAAFRCERLHDANWGRK